VTYDARRAASYWSGPRHERGDELAAVLSLGEPSAVNRAYDDWETGLLLASLGDLGPARVLDLGAGVGRVARRLAPRSGRLVCGDLAAGMLERLRRRLREDGIADGAYDRIRHRADVLPYRDRSFDVVVCLGLLEHLPPASRLGALSESARVVRPGGLLALVLNNAGSRFLGDPADNPHRVGVQRDNGYFCAVVNENEILAEAASWFEIECLGSNVLYSLQRHAARLLPETVREAETTGAFVEVAARWDRISRFRDGIAASSADHHLYLLRRR
jgi:SAM-dependent methyltransferase